MLYCSHMQTKSRNSDGEYDEARSGKRLDVKKIAIILIVLAAVIGGGVYKYNQYINSDSYKLAQAQKDTNNMIGNLAKLMALPNATPTLFTIDDPAKLSSNQAFFKDAVKGDVLFIYQDTLKAIIYSPSRNIVVNVGPINFDKSTVTPGEAKSSAEAPAIR